MSDDIRQRIMVQAEGMSRHGFEGVEQVLLDALDAIDAERAVVSLLEKSNDAKLEMWRQCESDLSATRKRLREAEEALRLVRQLGTMPTAFDAVLAYFAAHPEPVKEDT